MSRKEVAALRLYFGLLKNFKCGKDIRLYDAAELLTQRVNRYIDQEWRVQTNGRRWGALHIHFNGAGRVSAGDVMRLRVCRSAFLASPTACRMY